MKKTLDNLLDNFLLCNLYQVKEDIGYIDCYVIKGKYWIRSDYLLNENFDKVSSVIVKKNKVSKSKSKYNLKEIITGTPIDTLYEISAPGISIPDGKKSEYDTFILVSTVNHDIKIEELERYLEEHKDVEKYRNELKELLNNGSNNHSNKKKAEIEKINNDNLKVKSLLKKAKKADE